MYKNCRNIYNFSIQFINLKQLKPSLQMFNCSIETIAKIQVVGMVFKENV